MILENNISKPFYAIKGVFLLVLFFCYIPSISSQSIAKNASLRYLNEQPNDERKIKALLLLAEHVLPTQPDTAIKSTNIAIFIADSLELYPLQFRCNILLARIYIHQQNSPKAFQYINAAVNLGVLLEKDLWVQKSNVLFGDIFYIVNQLETAREFYTLALQSGASSNPNFLTDITIKYGRTFSTPPSSPVKINELLTKINSINEPNLKIKAYYLKATYLFNEEKYSESSFNYNKAINLLQNTTIKDYPKFNLYSDAAITYIIQDKDSLAKSTLAEGAKYRTPNSNLFANELLFLKEYLKSSKLQHSPIGELQMQLSQAAKSHSLTTLKQLFHSLIETKNITCLQQKLLQTKEESISVYLLNSKQFQKTTVKQLNHQLQIKNLYESNKLSLLNFQQEKLNWVWRILSTISLISALLILGKFKSFIPSKLKSYLIFLLSIIFGAGFYILITTQFEGYLEAHSFRNYGFIILILAISFWFQKLLLGIFETTD